MATNISYPEVRIQDGWLLRMNASKLIHELKAKKGEQLAGDKEIARIVAAYQKAWEYVEKQGYKEINKKMKESYKKLHKNNQ